MLFCFGIESIATLNIMKLVLMLVKYPKYCYSEHWLIRKLEGTVQVSTPLGDKIRALRKEKKLTLDKLAELSESSKGYIWELENKNPPRPSAEKVSKIAAALGVTTDYLMDTSESVGLEDATDKAFFRKYQQMSAPTKEKLRKMMELLDEDV